MQQHGSEYCVRISPPIPPDPEVGVKIIKIQDAYQIKGNRKCSKKVAKIFPKSLPNDPKNGVNRSIGLFSEHGHVAHQI